MFPLPINFPLDAYVGLRVSEVFEGSHFVDVKLGAPGVLEGLIQFEGPVVLTSPDAKARRFENEELLPGNRFFQHLAGCVITATRRVSDASCAVAFSNGWHLELVGEIGGFESYHLLVVG